MTLSPEWPTYLPKRDSMKVTDYSGLLILFLYYCKKMFYHNPMLCVQERFIRLSPNMANRLYKKICTQSCGLRQSYFLFWSDMLFINFLRETVGVQHNISSNDFVKSNFVK